MHTRVVSATSAVGHVGYEAGPKVPPKLGFKRESAVADHHKQREAMLASRNEVIARLGTLAVEPTFWQEFTKLPGRTLMQKCGSW